MKSFLSIFVLVLVFASLIVEARLSSNDVMPRRTEEWNCPQVNIAYPGAPCMIDDKPIYRWTLDELKEHSKQDACLMAIYDTVYEVKGFIDIHRGGRESIIRNCGGDATFGYESLVCIPGVPDHIPGVLSMLDGNFCSSIAGVIKGSDADPCEGEPADLPVPDFEGCAVYDVLTCDHLTDMPNGGRWDLEAVNNTESGACYAVLYNYVFALGLPPRDNPFTPPGSGTLTFENKHGGGPDAVRNNCQTDMTAQFELMFNKPGVPDHTKGALNAVLPYLVGVIQGSDVDPCVAGQEPPSACSVFNKISYTMSDVRDSNTSRCWVVVLGKIYDVQEFKVHHHGGADEIEEHCREDVTNDFFGKSFHTIVQLGAIKQFQVGVIAESMADPCSVNYIPNPDPADYGDGGDSIDEEEEEEEDAFTFKDAKGNTRDCTWLGNAKETKQNRNCKKSNVKSGCPDVCGAEDSPPDDSQFTFKNKRGKTKTCAWLGNQKRKAQVNYCKDSDIKVGCNEVCSGI
jgi:cytochrome b involved in lipid metabolism